MEDDFSVNRDMPPKDKRKKATTRAKEAAAAGARTGGAPVDPESIVGSKNVGQLIKRLWKKGRSSGVINPASLAMTGMYTLPWAANLGTAVADKFDAFGKEERLARAEALLLEGGLGAQSRRQEIERLRSKNLATLAQSAPHVFNELAAGMALPQDATVIGGKPRKDVLEAVADGMSQGRFPVPEEDGGVL